MGKIAEVIYAKYDLLLRHKINRSRIYSAPLKAPKGNDDFYCYITTKSYQNDSISNRCCDHKVLIVIRMIFIPTML